MLLCLSAHQTLLCNIVCVWVKVLLYSLRPDGGGLPDLLSIDESKLRARPIHARIPEQIMVFYVLACMHVCLKSCAAHLCAFMHCEELWTHGKYKCRRNKQFSKHMSGTCAQRCSNSACS